MQQTTIVNSKSQSQKKPFMDNIASGLNSFVHELEKGFVKTVEEVTGAWAAATDQRFRRIFMFPADERLIGEFWGQCISDGRAVSCTCYVSSNHFSFIVDTPSGKANVVLLLRDIVSVQAAVALRGSGAPIIQPVSDQYARADAFQVFTVDMKFHQFLGFLHFDKAYSALIHAWQALIAPPQPYLPQTYTPSAPQVYTTTTTSQVVTPPSIVSPQFAAPQSVSQSAASQSISVQLEKSQPVYFAETTTTTISPASTSDDILVLSHPSSPSPPPPPNM